MKDLFKDKGTVSLNLGYGYLTPHELTNLKKGDIIKTVNLAGHPFDLTFNDEFICKAEVIVLENSLGVRVSGFKKDELRPEQLGVIENALEVLPFTIKLEQIDLSLDEIKSVGFGSLIGLEKEYSNPAIVDLYVMNTHIASGEFICIDENFGIRLTKIFKQSAFKTTLRSSGYKLDVAINDFTINNYNFMRPDKFSKSQIMNFKAVQQIFLSNLNLIIPETTGYELTHVDQMTFNESFEMLQDNYSYVVINSTERPNEEYSAFYNRMVNNIASGMIQTKKSKYPDRPKKIKEWVKSWKNELKDTYEKGIIIAYNNKSVLSKIKDSKSITELIINPLNNAWKNIGGINFKYSRLEKELEKAKIIPDNDMILIASLSKKDDPNSNCYLIYPYIAIEPIIPLLD